MAEEVYDTVKELNRIQIVQGFGSESQDFEYFPMCKQ